MRNEMKKLAVGLLVASFLAAGITAGGVAYAANSSTGSIVSLAVTNNSLEDMLVNAISVEYMAQAEYNAVTEKFGVQRPFSNISRAEASHISLLLSLFEDYGVAVPDKDWDSMVAAPESLEAAYQAGADAESNNIAMYESFIKEDLPDEVKVVFERLLRASENHLRAFQNAVDGNCTGTGVGTGRQYGRMNNSRRGCGQGNRGNRNNLSGSCIFQ